MAHAVTGAPVPHSFSHGSKASYKRGFLISLVLTVLSFSAVMLGIVPQGAIIPVITILAVIQLVVQLGFFLHLGAAPEQRSDTMIFILAAMLISIIVGGSLWVMHNANINMMPTQISIERALQKD